MSRDAPNAPYLSATETPERSAVQRQEIAGELSGQLQRQPIDAVLVPLSTNCQKNVKFVGGLKLLVNREAAFPFQSRR